MSICSRFENAVIPNWIIKTEKQPLFTNNISFNDIGIRYEFIKRVGQYYSDLILNVRGISDFENILLIGRDYVDFSLSKSRIENGIISYHSANILNGINSCSEFLDETHQGAILDYMFLRYENAYHYGGKRFDSSWYFRRLSDINFLLNELIQRVDILHHHSKIVYLIENYAKYGVERIMDSLDAENHDPFYFEHELRTKHTYIDFERHSNRSKLINPFNTRNIVKV